MVQKQFEGGAISRESPRYQWTNYQDISSQLSLAVIAAEDQKFPYHHGFDLGAVRKAFEHNQEGGSLRGASTITQQVAKNLFLWPGRSYLRKGLEAYFALLIELLWTKQRILEVYVNIAQMGDNAFGAGAASRLFFDKPPSQLTPQEAALLAAVLPDPARFNVAHPSDYVLERQRWILTHMRLLGGIGYLKDI